MYINLMFNSLENCIQPREFFCVLFVAILLFIIVIFFSSILAVQKPETEKLSTYECGFEPYEDARHTFDVKFYLIAILFIIFTTGLWQFSLTNVLTFVILICKGYYVIVTLVLIYCYTINLMELIEFYYFLNKNFQPKKNTLNDEVNF